jgi:hypothetical protein
MNKKNNSYNFNIIFQKLSELKNSKEDLSTQENLIEFEEINKLREIVLDVSSNDEQSFSTT